MHENRQKFLLSNNIFSDHFFEFLCYDNVRISCEKCAKAVLVTDLYNITGLLGLIASDLRQ